jgi:Lar family restriction alleviation protein
MNELKPCPFCGEDNPIMQVDKEEYSLTYCVQCWHCDCRTDDYPNEEEAIERWNRRADNGTTLA